MKITSVSPSQYSMSGGVNVVIKGTAFAAGATVLFGGQSAAVTFNSDTQLTAVLPAGSAPGPVNITVANTANAYTVTGYDFFTYLAARPAAITSPQCPDRTGPTRTGGTDAGPSTGRQLPGRSYR